MTGSSREMLQNSSDDEYDAVSVSRIRRVAVSDRDGDTSAENVLMEDSEMGSDFVLVRDVEREKVVVADGEGLPEDVFKTDRDSVLVPSEIVRDVERFTVPDPIDSDCEPLKDFNAVNDATSECEVEWELVAVSDIRETDSALLRDSTTV